MVEDTQGPGVQLLHSESSIVLFSELCETIFVPKFAVRRVQTMRSFQASVWLWLSVWL